MKNLNEFTKDINDLIRDLAPIKKKIDKLRGDIKNEATFYFDEMALSAAAIDQTLGEVFNLAKAKEKNKNYVIVSIRSNPIEFLINKRGTNLRTSLLGEATRYDQKTGEAQTEKINKTYQRSGNKGLLVGLMHVNNFSDESKSKIKRRSV